jgi:cytidylate kinase
MAEPVSACRNVVICGLTAAGKTTHAQRLAAELNYEYVSGTAILARLLEVETAADPPRWANIAHQIASRRSDDTDRELERELLKLARARSRQVFDVWALPWSSDDADLIRIWIGSTLTTRTWKSFVSQGVPAERSLTECRRFVQEKDEFNRELFRRTIGFDLYSDHDVFNIRLDNSCVISDPTLAATRRGIEQFAPVVRAAFDVCHGLAPSSVVRECDDAISNGQTVISVDPRPRIFQSARPELQALRSA